MIPALFRTRSGLATNVGRRFLSLSLTAALALLATCGGDGPTAPTGPPRLVISAGGEPQTAVVGGNVPVRPAVRIVDASGAPMPGVLVTFAVSAGGGSVTGGTQTTGDDGVARVESWSLGTTAGAQALTAESSRVPNVSVTFAATATPGPDAALVLLTPVPTTVAAGSAIAAAFEVEVRDEYGNRTPSVSSISLALANNPTNAVLSGTTNTVAIAGRASFAGLTVATAGIGYTIRATLGDVVSAPSTAFNVTAGAPAALAAASGDGQIAVVGSAVANPPAVRVTDIHGNATQGVTVTFSVDTGGGLVTAPAATTDELGLASVGAWTVGTVPGVNRLLATAPFSVAPVSFVATAVAGPPASLAFLGSPTETVAGAALMPAPRIQVQDAYGNALQEAATPVTIAVGTNPGNGTLTGTTVRSATAGVAEFGDLIIKRAAQGYTLTAAATGLTGAVSTEFTIVAGPPAAVAVSSGDAQSALAGTTVPVQPSAQVVDAHGNGVAGILVTFAPAANSGSVTGPTATTGSDGIATAGGWLLGGNPGQQTLLASGAGVAESVSFTATALPNGTISGTVTLSNSAFANPSLRAMSLATPNAPADATAARPTTSAATYAPSLARTPLQRKARGAVYAELRARRFSASERDAGERESGVPRNGPDYVPGELLVEFRPAVLSRAGVTRAELRRKEGARAADAAMRAHLTNRSEGQIRSFGGVSGVDVTGSMPALGIARVRIPHGSDVEAVIRELSADPDVSRVTRPTFMYALGRSPTNRDGREWLGPLTTMSPIRPTDPLSRAQWWHYDLVSLPRAWSHTTGAASITVAVVDDGIRFDHPDIAGNLTNDGYDFVTDVLLPACGGGFIGNAGDGNGPDPDATIPVSYSFDGSSSCVSGVNATGGHGLHVAGTIGATANDGIGLSGVNWSVRIRPVRVLGSAGVGSSADIAAGILYAAGFPVVVNGTPVQATSRAAVINLSLGGPADDPIQRAAVDSAIAAGSLVVVAAGNDNTDAPMYPAAYPGVLTVSAVGPTAERSSYSNYGDASQGSKIDVAAPGGDQSRFGTSSGIASTTWRFSDNTPTWEWKQGTSMAAPHVAGVAALILSREPGLTGAQLKARLMATAEDIGASGPDNVFGAGLLNAWRAVAPSATIVRASTARLYNAETGTLMASEPVSAGASYQFKELDNGSYWVFAGQDEDGDGRTGVPGRRWGAFGIPSAPTSVTVAGAGTYTSSFFVGLPVEAEPNNDAAQSNALVIGGYVAAWLETGAVDVFRVLVPAPGQYTFETEAVLGSCGFALEENTVLELFSGAGSPLSWSDDVGGLNYCSRVTMSLSAGVYYLRVSGYTGGRYQLSARAG